MQVVQGMVLKVANLRQQLLLLSTPREYISLLIIIGITKSVLVLCDHAGMMKKRLRTILENCEKMAATRDRTEGL